MGLFRDNLHGEEPYEPEKIPSDQSYNVVTNSASALEKSDSSVSGLPANDGKLSPINWLGSSYSGADIKVVVHLYGDADTSVEETRLADQLALFEQLADAFGNLDIPGLIQGLSIGMTTEGITKLLPITAETDSRVLGMLFSFISDFSRANISVSALSSSMEAARRSNINFYTSQAEEYRNRLNKLSEIRKQSSSTLVLGNLQTLSVQTFREKEPVKALGSANVKGYTRGQRLIAGSMIFTLFNEHSLAKLCQSLGTQKSKYGELDTDLSAVLGDQLPPLDLTIVFANEYGSLSRAAIYGVEFLSSGITLSIEDLLSEEVIQFVARDIDPMVSHGNIGLSRDQRGMHFNSDGARDTKGSDLLFTSKDSYNEFLDKKLKIRRRLVNR